MSELSLRGIGIPAIPLGGFHRRDVTAVTTQAKIREIMLGARGRSTNFQREHQQHKRGQPRGGAQAGEQGAGRSRIHPSSIHTWPDVMKFHP